MKAIYWYSRIAVMLFVVVTFAAPAAAQEFPEPIYKDAVRDTTGTPSAATDNTAVPTGQTQVGSGKPLVQSPSTTGRNIVIALIIVLIIGAVIAWLLRRRGGNAHGNHGNHGGGHGANNAHGGHGGGAQAHGAQHGNHGHATPPATPPAAGAHDHTRPARPAREDHAGRPATAAAPAVAPVAANPADAIAHAARTPAPVATATVTATTTTPATPPTGGAAGTTATGIILFLLALPALGMAQTVTPAAMVMGYPTQEFKIAPAGNCAPTEVFVQNGVKVSSIGRSGNAITFHAQAINGATLGPTRVHVKCQDGSTMNVSPFAVLTPGESFVGSMVNSKIAAHNAQVAALQQELRSIRTKLSTANAQVAALQQAGSTYATKSQVETLSAQATANLAREMNRLAQAEARMAELVKVTNDHSTAIMDMDSRLQYVENGMKTVENGLETVASVVSDVNTRQMNARVPGFLGIGSKQQYKKNSEPMKEMLEDKADIDALIAALRDARARRDTARQGGR